MSKRPHYEAKKPTSVIEIIKRWFRLSDDDRVARLIAIFGIIVSIIGIVVSHSDSKSGSQQLEKLYNIQDNFFGLWSVDPAKATLSYATGMELYNLKEYEWAAAKFRDALNDQEKLKGGDSIDVGKIYALLGLSELYSVTDSEKAIADLTSARKIFESNNDLIHVAWCYYYLATMYFENGADNLNLANEAVDCSIKAANQFCSDGVRLISYRFEDKSISFPEDYDLSKLYMSARYCELMQNLCNLRGKISFAAGNINESVQYFNMALEYCSKWSTCHYYLDIVLGSENGANGEDYSEIIEYIDQIRAPEVLNNLIDVKIYEFNNGLYDRELFFTVSVLRGSDTATFLTNRAMGELRMQNYSDAIFDCDVALSIWDTLPYSQRSVISDTYTCLALSELAEGKKNGNEIIKYFDYAVSYDRELFGANIRTAKSFENRGNANCEFQEFDLALKDYLEAYCIYLDIGEHTSAQTVRDQMEEIYSAIQDYGTFDEWLTRNTS